MKYNNESKTNTIFKIINVILIISVIVINVFKNASNVNFITYNGSFQNYNPIRRLLSGQIQYVDFYDYLGFGHAYLGAILSIIFGNTFQSSLIVFNLLQIISFVSIIILLSKLISKEYSEVLISMGLIISYLFNLIRIENDKHNIITRIVFRISSAASVGYTTGNSARFVRAMIIPISLILFIIFIKKIYFKLSKEKKYYITTIFVSFVGAISFLYSNDFGISVFLSFNLIYLFVLFIDLKKFKKVIFYELINVILFFIFVIILVSIYTKGNLISYINAFKDLGSYQRWYYNSVKHFYLYEICFGYTIFLCLCVIIYYINKIRLALKKTKEINNDILKDFGVLFVNLASFIQMQIYYMLSGGYAFEVGTLVVIFTVVFEVLNIFLNKINKESLVRIVLSVFSILFIINLNYQNINKVYNYFDRKNKDTYIASLDGSSEDKYDELMKADVFLKEEKFFSTYATAFETMKNTFQPTGDDYIIHVLSDKKRENYLDVFRKEEHKYVITLKPTSTIWEIWAERANWFFYRELYKNYHPVMENTYWVFWEKNDKNTNTSINNEIVVEDINEYTKKIIIKTNTDISGLADLYIDFESEKKKSMKSLFMFNSMVSVKNSHKHLYQIYEIKDPSPSLPDYMYPDYETNYLRNKSKEYIPIRITDGYGEVTITSLPEKDTILKINDIRVLEIYTVTKDYEDMLYK